MGAPLILTQQKSEIHIVKRNSILLLSLIFLYVIFIRIPQFTSNNFLPDQDECLLGMMANHFLKGQNFPFFFYGQHYGLSTLEVLLIAPFIKIFGVTTFAIKMPMLLLYMAALTFLFLWVRNNLGLIYAFLITLFFAAEPTWLIWAMKARGGYLSALLVGFYLLYQWQKTRNSPIMYLINAFLMGLLYHFHLLWFVAFVPLFIFYQYKLGSKKILQATFVVAITIIAFYIIAQTTEELWLKPSTAFHLNFDFIAWQKKLMVFLSGHFYFGYAYDLKYGVILSTKLLFIVHLLVMSFSLGIILKNKLFSELLIWFLIVLFLFFVPLFAFKGGFHYRYWLPMSVAFIGLFISLIKELSSFKIKKILAVVVVVIAFLDIGLVEILLIWIFIQIILYCKKSIEKLKLNL